MIKGLAGRVRRWLDGATRHEDVRYRTQHEIALQNAADALGVSLGEDYLDAGFEIPDELVAGIAESGNPDRLDASREELLVYIERARGKRRRRMRRRRLTLVFVAVAAAFVLVQVERQGVSSNGRDDSQKSIQDAWLKLPRVARSPMGLPEPVVRGVSTEMRDGAGRIILSTFRDMRGDICSTVTNLMRGAFKGKGGGSCIPPSELSLDLATEPAFYSRLSGSSRYFVLTGYGRADLERIVSRGPRRVDINISSAWQLEPKRRFSIKVFMLRVWHLQGADSDWGSDLLRGIGHLDLTAVLSSGQTIRMKSWDEMARASRAAR